MLEKIAKAKFISTIDLTKGYWQIPLDNETIPKSAFITPRGLFEFTNICVVKLREDINRRYLDVMVQNELTHVEGVVNTLKKIPS